MNDILKILRHRIKKDCGKRCKDFNINCAACQAYLAMDILEDFYSVGNEGLDMQWEKDKHK